MEGVDALSYYDVECSFRLVETNCPDLLRLSASPRIQQVLFVAHSTLFTIQSMLRRWDGNTLLYTRAETWIQARAAPGPERASRLRHSSPGLDSGPLGRPLFRRCTALPATRSPPLAQTWHSKMGIRDEFPKMRHVQPF